MNTKVSIIIPVRFRPDLTEACLDSIVKYTENYELILVQEGKDSDITKLLERYDAKFIHNKKPKGFSGAMNSGLKLATGDYYCFLNNDTVVVRGWLDEMLKAFDDKTVGMVTPTFGGAKSLQHVDYNNGQRFQYIKNTDLLNLMAVCFLVSKECMDKVGEWDERFGLGGGEDNDMCIRIHQAGYRIVVARKSYIYHYCGASFRELFKNNPETFKKESDKQFEVFKKKYEGKLWIQ
jgi:GT2 family glycosyltransferase